MADRRHLALIGCCAQKAGEPAPARELYRSHLFRLSLAFAEQRGAEPFVLSARHGLVALDRVLNPYDLALADLSAAERAEWAHFVGLQLRDLLGIDFGEPSPRGTCVLLLAGALYRPELPEGCDVEEPLRGMGIGRRKAWLIAQLTQQEVARAG